MTLSRSAGCNDKVGRSDGVQICAALLAVTVHHDVPNSLSELLA